ncbi:hypothetical protein [Runella salmonicolor]|uniref:HNH endonuclease n=1 Tax=Runella salmonicolor TaxID=2950278 RepID=A0ABT1FXD9_9BACT|nr:hypothetical protein [Runella salmonicolor]MCP1386436.1 hypothetical protein [Runella salmonicolor]
MPIKYKYYPKNWFTELRPAVLDRAKHACENCLVPNHAVVRWDSRSKKFIRYENEMPKTYQEAQKLRNELNDGYMTDFIDWKVIKLAIAHLDHDVRNNDLTNLQALCQRCHLNHDRADNGRRRRYGKLYHKDQLVIDFR